MPETDRRLILSAFFCASNITHYHGGWRVPEASNRFLDATLYPEIGRTLERGSFDLVFLPDAHAVEDRYGDNLHTGLGLGAQGATMMDPMVPLSMIAAATEKIGLGVTISTTYSRPFQVAKTLATLDHLSRGRAAWNIVTSLNASEARNYGERTHLEHDRRYDRADEFLEVTEGLWHSWGPDALVLDKAGGTFADSTKVDYLDHKGEWFDVRGPLPLPAPPQGRPLIIQAGVSPRGRNFGARWADLMFAIAPNRHALAGVYRNIKETAAAAGRDPDTLRVIPAIIPVIGRTGAEAREKLEHLNSLVDPRAGLSTLSSHLDVDLSRFDLDDPLDTVLRAIDGTVGGIRGMFDQVISATATAGGTLADLGREYGWVMVERFVGTGEQVADQIADYFDSRIADGFAISPTVLPDTYTEFVDEVVPVLREKGVHHDGYGAGDTLRDRLGLPYRPAGRAVGIPVGAGAR